MDLNAKIIGLIGGTALVTFAITFWLCILAYSYMEIKKK